MDSTLNLLVFAALGYLLGSVPFAVIVSRAFRLADPRSFGSGNPGATNVLRSGSKAAALLTLLGDAAKGWDDNEDRHTRFVNCTALLIHWSGLICHPAQVGLKGSLGPK